MPRKTTKPRTPNPIITKEIEREFLLAFWKIHILHHAEKKPVVGQWAIRELRHHGYDVSPGTMYPLLKRLEERGWLSCKVDPSGGAKARREYTLTSAGRGVLRHLRESIGELHREVVLGEDDD